MNGVRQRKKPRLKKKSGRQVETGSACEKGAKKGANSSPGRRAPRQFGGGNSTTPQSPP
jgi:hypothetical protein